MINETSTGRMLCFVWKLIANHPYIKGIKPNCIHYDPAEKEVIGRRFSILLLIIDELHQIQYALN